MAKDATPKKAAKKTTSKTAAKPDAPAKPKRSPAAPDAAPAVKPARAPKADAAPRAPVEKVRVVIPMAVYDPRKDEIKAPIKAAALKWNFLGEGKGLYKRDGLHVFTQFMDDGVHYSVWGDDKPAVKALLDAWRAMLGDSVFQQAQAAGEAAVKAEAQEKESEALRLWKLQEPQRRPGEPDFFFKKRVDEWAAKKPA